MLSITKKIRLIFIGLSLCILLGLTLQFIFARWPDTFKLKTDIDGYFFDKAYSPSSSVPEDLIIIDSDDPFEQRSRSEYAYLIRKLNSAGVRCIAFDIRFLGERAKVEDQDLVQSVMSSPNVILAIDFSVNYNCLPTDEFKLNGSALPDSLCRNFMVNYKIEGVGLPFPALLNATHRLGHITYVPDEYRRFPLVLRFREKCYASLPLEIVRTVYAYPSFDESTNGNGIATNGKASAFDIFDIPLDSEEQLLIDFIPEEKFNKFSVDETTALLQENSDIFFNKIVLVVNSASEPKGPSPLGPYPKWARVASATHQILHEQYIDASPIFGPTAASTVFIFCGLIWLLFVTHYLKPFWRKTRSTFFFGNVFCFLFVVVLLKVFHIWIGIVVVLFVFNASLLNVRHRYYKYIRAPRYDNLELSITYRQGAYYQVQIIDSLVGQHESKLSFKSFLDEDFLQTVTRIRSYQNTRTDMHRIGETLFNALFQDESFYALKSSLEQTKNLRVRLRIDAPELMCLPWEMMYSSRIVPGFLALNPRVSISRFISLSQPHQIRKIEFPVKILVAAALPHGVESLEIEKEIRLIKKIMLPLVLGGDVRVRFCQRSSLAELADELEWQPDILHFIGHGFYDEGENQGFLKLETEAGQKELVSAEALGTVLLDSSVKFAILNNCDSAAASPAQPFTGIAQNLVRIGLPSVVAMQFPILDPSAIIFSKSFYKNLINEHSVEAALTRTRQALMRKAGLLRQDWATPVLFTRTNSEHLFLNDN